MTTKGHSIARDFACVRFRQFSCVVFYESRYRAEGVSVRCVNKVRKSPAVSFPDLRPLTPDLFPARLSSATLILFFI